MEFFFRLLYCRRFHLSRVWPELMEEKNIREKEREKKKITVAINNNVCLPILKVVSVLICAYAFAKFSK